MAQDKNNRCLTVYRYGCCCHYHRLKNRNATMNKYMKYSTLAIFSLFFVSCVTLTEKEKSFAKVHEITKHKSPATAAGLSLLPGVGNLYLATGGGRKNDTLRAIAMLNWVSWPASVIWAVPQAYIDAGRINIRVSAKNYQ